MAPETDSKNSLQTAWLWGLTSRISQTYPHKYPRNQGFASPSFRYRFIAHGRADDPLDWNWNRGAESWGQPV